MSELRIAFVASLATGGTARHVATLAAGCRDAGLDVSIFAPRETIAAVDRARTQAGARSGIETRLVAIGDRPRPRRDVIALARLRAGLSAWRPDVVHAHGVRAGAFAALATARMRGGPALAITVHNAPPDGRSARFVYGLLERVCARRADVVLGASGDLVTRMRRLGAHARQFDVPAAPLQPPSPTEVSAVRDAIGAAGRPVVLAVSRLAAQKGLDVLVAAAAAWRGRDPQPRTVIAGDGPLAAALLAQARQADADVVLLGARADVAALLAVADVVVVPSRWEARALILQEALRAGRPVVATRVGGTPELTGADGALLVPPADPASLTAAITAVLDDPHLAARLGAAARARSATFPSVGDATAEMLSLYRRISPDHS